MTARTAYLTLPLTLSLIASSAVNIFYFPPGVIFPDEQRFLDAAIGLARTGGLTDAHDMPAAILLYAGLIYLFGAPAILPIRITQSLLLALQLLMIADLSQRLFRDTRMALIAATLAAVYPFFLFYQGLLLSETLFNTFLIAAFASLYRWRDRGMRLDAAFLLTMLCFAAATLTRATLTILPPLLVAAVAFREPTPWRNPIRILLAATLAYSALLSPWWVRNYAALGAFVPFTTTSGQNLYLGNNKNNPHGGVNWAADAEPDVVARIRAIPDEVERQRAFNAAAINYIRNNPVAFMRVAVHKFIRFWSLVPNAEPYNRGWYAFITAASFGPLLLFALIGAWMHLHTWREFLPLYLLIGYFTALHCATIASLRYRLPLEPFLILLAATPATLVLLRLRVQIFSGRN